jgi:O-antigen ligase
MQQSITYNKQFFWLISLLLLGCIALYEFTGYYYVLAAPLLLEYLFITVQNWKKAYWILLFTIPFSVQFSLIDHQLSISIPDEPITWIFMLLAVIIVAERKHKIPLWWLSNPITLIIALQFLWLIVSVTHSEVVDYSLKFLLAKSWYLIVFFLFPLWIFTEKDDFVKGYKILLIPIVITMVIIMCRHALLHFRFADVNHAIGSLYYNHVEYSTVIAMFFPLILVAYHFSQKTEKKRKWGYISLIIFFSVCIFFSYARAAIISVAFAGLVGIAIKKKYVNSIMPAFYISMLAVVLYLSDNRKYIEYRPKFDHTYMHYNFTDHLIATFRGRDISSMERFYRWIAAVRMSTEKPITGYGPHSFYYFYKPYTVSLFKTYVSANTERSTTHNYFLLMLVEQGLPAMLLYALLIIVVFAQAQKTYHRFKDPFYKACTLGICMVFAAGFINNFFSEMIETHKVGAFFYLCLSLLVILNQKSKTIQEKQ